MYNFSAIQGYWNNLSQRDAFFGILVIAALLLIFLWPAAKKKRRSRAKNQGMIEVVEKMIGRKIEDNELEIVDAAYLAMQGVVLEQMKPVKVGVAEVLNSYSADQAQVKEIVAHEIQRVFHVSGAMLQGQGELMEALNKIIKELKVPVIELKNETKTDSLPAKELEQLSKEIKELEKSFYELARCVGLAIQGAVDTATEERRNEAAAFKEEISRGMLKKMRTLLAAIELLPEEKRGTPLNDLDESLKEVGVSVEMTQSEMFPAQTAKGAGKETR